MSATALRLAVIAVLVALSGCSSSTHMSMAADDGGIGEPLVLPLDDGGAVTWDGWAGEFVTGYCVQCHNPSATSCLGSGCHPSNGALPDFRLRTAVVAYAPMIRCGVSVQQDPAWECSAAIPPEKFPVSEGANPIPTEAQRGIFAGWIDAGCP